MPASEQLKRIVANREIVNPALQKINGVELSAWSSCEYSSGDAWEVCAINGNVSDLTKYTNYKVRQVCPRFLINYLSIYLLIAIRLTNGNFFLAL